MDGSGVNYVVENYLEYYDLFAKYLSDTLSSDDTLAVTTLANLCPMTDGSVIYQARSLYAAIHCSLGTYDDTCNGSNSTDRIAGNNSYHSFGNSDLTKGNQDYRLYPNPTDGNISIEQAVKTDRIVSATLYNATGMILTKTTLNFVDGINHMQIQNVVPGLYLLELVDESGNVFNLKFVIK